MIHVVVTQADIDAAVAAYPTELISTSCPVAQALRRVTGEEWSVGVRGANRTGAYYDGRVQLPTAVASWISAFDLSWPDARAASVPFEFDLEGVTL